MGEFHGPWNVSWGSTVQELNPIGLMHDRVPADMRSTEGNESHDPVNPGEYLNTEQSQWDSLIHLLITDWLGLEIKSA